MNERLVSRGRLARTLLAVVVGALSIGRASAQLNVQDDWITRVNGSSPEYVVVDSSGNVYTKVSSGTYKYDRAGNVLAFVQAAAAILGPDLVAQTSKDPDGTLVVAVADDAGTVLWQARVPRLNAAVPLSNIAADAAGNVYVAASGTDVTTGAAAPFLAKVGPNGVAWTVQAIAASGLAVDKTTGAAYLTGPAGTAGYDAAGQALWQVASPGTNLKLLPSGALFVVNRIDVNGVFGFDLTVYDAAGTLTSSASGAYTASTDNRYSRVAAIGDDGSIFLAGTIMPYGWWDGLVVKFDSRGTVVWASQGHEIVGTLWTAMTVDARGNVYVGGQSYSSTAGWRSTIKKCDGAYGARVWSEVNATGDGVTSMAVDAAGNVYTLGTNFGWAQLVKSSEYATVTAEAGAGGSISPSGVVKVAVGGSQTYTIAPAAGYAVASVLVDGVSVGAVTSYTFSNVTAPHTISATFKQAIAVTAPNGGESWKRGSTQTIRWSFAGAPGTAVKIELLSGTTVSRVIATSAPIGASGAGSFTWKVPANQAAGTAYKVRVTSTTVAAATDSSDAAFSITK